MKNTLPPTASTDPPDPAIAALLPAYLQRRTADGQRLEEALAALDFATIGGIAHRLKGLGSTYGHDAISQAGSALEAAAHANNAAEIRQLIDHYKRLLAELH